MAQILRRGAAVLGVALTLILALGGRRQAQAGPATKLGVHILEPEEVAAASELLPNGGYVTVPIRLDQRQNDRWQTFFDQAARFRLTPIIRLATEPDGVSWRRPTRRDVVVHGNFLNSLDWHADQLIVVLFNEPNHALEWGGEVDAASYGRMLAFAASWFNTERRDYFVLPAALDTAAWPTGESVPSIQFLADLLVENPVAFYYLDGWNSHAYPNPHFTGRPTDLHSSSVRSYLHELAIIEQVLELTFPVFITETGWDNTKLSGQTIASYFRFAWNDVWASDGRVKSVTPFLLNAQSGPFAKFSLTGPDNQPLPIYHTIKELSWGG